MWRLREAILFIGGVREVENNRRKSNKECDMLHV